MTPNVKRNLATKILALALVACVCALAVGSSTLRRARAASQPRADKVSQELREFVRKSGAESIAVILQLSAQPSGQLNALLQRNGVRVHGRFANLDAIAAELPASVVNELASFEEVESLTRDREVESSGHVTATTGADAVRTLPALKGGSVKVDGTGVGIAVLDSGVYAAHISLKDAGGAARTVFAQDFTGENRTEDSFGHGSHVASTAAGNDKLSGQSGTFAGVAPNASLINLRVLDSSGRGRVSWVLAALDWVVANGSRYKVRVVNMSLGMPAVDSYKVDPLCRAVRRLADAGFVVVAAAGNDGKSTSSKYGTNNTKTYGLIHSPGNEPSAITVGASNTFGTDDRRDDGVATYSSRGPTRSFWTDSSGVKHFDNLVKPDLVAPGNKIIYAKAAGNFLAGNYSELSVTPVEGGGDTKTMMYMSGTSVASPVVAGAAALMLQVNPSLTPNMLKMILMYTAQPLAGFNQLEQGSGELNVDGAVRLAQRVRTDLSAKTKIGDPLLSTAAPAAQSTVAGYTFPWAQGVTVNHGFLTGSALATKYQAVYAKGRLLGDGVSETYDSESVNTSMMSSGIMMCDGIMMADGTPWGDEPVFMANGIMLADGIMMADTTMLADGFLMSDGTMLADGIMMADNTVGSLSVMVSGEGTAFMR